MPLKIKGNNEIVIGDVLIGEVWLGSGQSNMAMTVKASQDFQKEQSNAQFPMIRMFKEESSATTEEQTIGKGQWVVCSPESVGGFSATLYFFGREIHKAIGVPVGLINSSEVGIPIESWISIGCDNDWLGNIDSRFALRNPWMKPKRFAV